MRTQNFKRYPRIKVLSMVIMLLFSVSTTWAWAVEPAAVEELNATRWYKVYWGGVYIADLKAQINGDRIDAVIDSYGIVKKVSKYSSKTHAFFKEQGGVYVPASFYTKFNERQRLRTIDIQYDDKGEIVQEAVTPPDNRQKRPAVSNELKADSVDPLTAVVLARHKIKEALAADQKKFAFKLYDGRRLSLLNFIIHGKSMADKGDGTKVPVLVVSFKRHPVAGYTKNELERIRGEEPNVTLYLSDDALLLPVRADADAPLGSAEFVLEKECASLEACI